MAAYLELSRDELIETIRLGAADLLHHGLVQPDPVDGVNVDRNGAPLAVSLGEPLQRRRNELVQPSFPASDEMSASAPCSAYSSA